MVRGVRLEALFQKNRWLVDDTSKQRFALSSGCLGEREPLLAVRFPGA